VGKTGQNSKLILESIPCTLGKSGLYPLVQERDLKIIASQQPYQDKVLALQFIASPLASAGDLCMCIGCIGH
jgi:hypothetical protein